MIRRMIIWICLELIYHLVEEDMGFFVNFKEHWSINGDWGWAVLDG